MIKFYGAVTSQQWAARAAEARGFSASDFHTKTSISRTKWHVRGHKNAGKLHKAPPLDVTATIYFYVSFLSNYLLYNSENLRTVGRYLSTVFTSRCKKYEIKGPKSLFLL